MQQRIRPQPGLVRAPVGLTRGEGGLRTGGVVPTGPQLRLLQELLQGRDVGVLLHGQGAHQAVGDDIGLVGHVLGRGDEGQGEEDEGCPGVHRVNPHPVFYEKGRAIFSAFFFYPFQLVLFAARLRGLHSHLPPAMPVSLFLGKAEERKKGLILRLDKKESVLLHDRQKQKIRIFTFCLVEDLLVAF